MFWLQSSLLFCYLLLEEAPLQQPVSPLWLEELQLLAWLSLRCWQRLWRHSLGCHQLSPAPLRQASQQPWGPVTSLAWGQLKQSLRPAHQPSHQSRPPSFGGACGGVEVWLAWRVGEGVHELQLATPPVWLPHSLASFLVMHRERRCPCRPSFPSCPFCLSSPSFPFFRSGIRPQGARLPHLGILH